MIKFRQYIKEDKKITNHLEKLATAGRESCLNKNKGSYGDCGVTSRDVHNEIKKHYKSSKVVGGEYLGNKKKHIGDGHMWVEIPETGHFIDATHDQFHSKHPHLRSKGTPNRNAIKIGKINSKYYKKNYEKKGEWADQDLHHLG